MQLIDLNQAKFNYFKQMLYWLSFRYNKGVIYAYFKQIQFL